MLNRAAFNPLLGRALRRVVRLPMPVIVAGLVLLSLLFVVRLASGAVERLAQEPRASDDPTPVMASIGSERLAIPRHMIRRDTEAAPGRQGVELHLHWPSLEGYTTERSALFRSGASSQGIIYLSLRSDSTGLSPQERLHSLYPRLLEDHTRRMPGGIVVRAFRDGYGYDGEALYIASDPVEPLIARCSDRDELVPTSCLSGFRTGSGLEVGYRFPVGLIGDWRRLDADLRALVADFQAIASAD